MTIFRSILKNVLPTIIVLVVLIAFSFTSQGRVFVKSSLFLAQFVPNSPFKVPSFLGDKFTVERVEVNTPTGKIDAELYRPQKKGIYPATIFSLGTEGFNNSPNVKRYAGLYAKAGFVVLVPNIPDLINITLKDSTVEDMVSLFEFLYGKDFVDKDNIGFSGVCAGGSMSLVAAADPRISDNVAYVNVISPYFDVRDLSYELFTGRVWENGKEITWQPNPDAQRSLKLWYVNFIDDEKERETIKKIIINSGSLSTSELESLSVESRAIFSFLKNVNPEDFEKLEADLPAVVKFQVEKMSPRSALSSLKAKVYVLSDIYDDWVYNSHSRRLAESLPDDQIRFTTLESLQHVIFGREFKRIGLVRDGVKVFLHVYSLLSQVSS